MEKENEKLALKLKKKEILRVTDMAVLARKKDPRIMAFKQAQKDAKEAAVAAKEAAIKDAAAAKERAEAEAKEQAATNKAEKDKARKKASGG
jgi:DnaJ family protein C protein 2